MRKIILIVCLMLLACESYGQVSSWMKTFGGPRDDRGYYAFQTNDSGFVMIGERAVQLINNSFYIPQTYIVKLNYNGAFQWQRLIGDSLYGNYGYRGVEDDFGNFYITYNSGRGFLTKLSNIGTVLWTRIYPDSIESMNGIMFSNEKKFLIIIGSTYSPSLGLSTVSLTKLDTSGNMVWSKSYYDTNNYHGNATGLLVEQDAYYISCFKGDTPSPTNGIIIKTDTSGRIAWKKILNTQTNRLYTIVQNSSSTFIASGDAIPIQSTQYLKFDAEGKTIWHKYCNMRDTCGYSMTKTLDGKFALVGGQVYGGASITIMDSLGNIISFKRHNVAPLNLIEYKSIKNSSDSGFIIAGVFTLTDADYDDCLIVKTDKNGNTIPLGINKNSEIPKSFLLHQNYPNPFNPITVISYELAVNSFVTLKVFDILGKEVKILVDKNLKPGKYSIDWTPKNLPSGIYFCSMYIDNKIVQSIKLIMLK